MIRQLKFPVDEILENSRLQAMKEILECPIVKSSVEERPHIAVKFVDLFYAGIVKLFIDLYSTTKTLCVLLRQKS